MNSTTDHIKIDLGSVQKTLLLPLWGRAIETRKLKPKLNDDAAAEIIDKIDYDFSTIAANISWVTQLAWIARSFHIDNAIKNFQSRHHDAVVVNLGCGLDTTYERFASSKLTWFDLDLPDVIELRKKFLHETAKRKFISSSLLSEDWTEQVKPKDPVLFIAAGVLYYFDESQVKNIFRILAAKFHSAELIFDAVTPFGLQAANKSVIKGGGMDETAFLKWGIKNSAEMLKWDISLQVISEFPLFEGFKKSLSLKEKYGTFLSDLLKIMYMVHLKFGKHMQD